VSPWYEAVTVWGPGRLGVYWTWQLALVRLQLVALKLPFPLGEAVKSTLPVGVVGVPPLSVSATVAVQVVGVLAARLGVSQERVVLVDRPLSVRTNALELEVLCVVSPP
jgi:hypothetical protein